MREPARDADPGVTEGAGLAAQIKLVARGDVAAFDAVYDQVAASAYSRADVDANCMARGNM